jgi:phosphoribosylanthranilate isomerase
MALEVLTKVSSVTNLSDARYCAGMGVHLMGFCIDSEEEKFLDPSKYQEITSWIAGVQKVGEYHRADEKKLEEIMTQYDLDFLELLIDQKDLKQISENVPLIAVFNAKHFSDRVSLKNLLDEFNPFVHHFIFTSEEYDLPIEVLELSAIYPIILGTGVGEENVLDLIKKHHIHGIALKGGEEITPGYKDFDELADILEKIEIEED